jgi:hypothetical protein
VEVSVNDDSNNSNVPFGVVVFAELGFSGVGPPLTQSNVTITEACAATGRATAAANTAIANKRLKPAVAFIDFAVSPNIELLPFSRYATRLLHT